MPAIDFPAAPAVNDEYSFEGRTWRWNGTGWEVKEYPAALLAGTAANPSLYFSGDPNTGLYSPGADQVAISTGGTGRLFVDSAGNVGIGTSSPGENLDVVATESAGNVTIRARNLSTTTNSVSAILLEGGNGAVVGQMVVDGLGSVRGLAAWAGTASNHPFLFLTNNTERLRITSTGNVGIGTSSPGQRLEIQATAGASQNAVIRLRATDSGSNAGSVADISAIGTGAQVSALAFSTRDGTNIVERLRIDGAGNVGIGTSSPSYALDVSGTGRAAKVIAGSTTDLGLSTTLEVFQSGYAALAAFRSVPNDGVNPYLLITSSSSGITLEENGSSYGSLMFKTGATERVRLDSSGRLLVGTSASETAFATNLQIVGINEAASSQLNLRYSNDALSPVIYLGKSRGATVGTNTIVQTGDTLGTVAFYGATGTTYSQAASIVGAVDAEPGTAGDATDMPGRLVFSTTADGAAAPTEAMRINNQRELLIGTTTRTANGGVLQVSNGITFPGTQSACSDANTLDDYEEGTFTPTIVGTGTAGAGTYSVQVGRYTKIGQRVYFQINLTWSAHTGTTNMIVGALPFTSANVQAVSAVSIRHSNLTSPASTVVQGYVTQNATTITLESIAVAGGAAAALALDTAATLTVAGDYEAA